MPWVRPCICQDNTLVWRTTNVLNTKLGVGLHKQQGQWSMHASLLEFLPHNDVPREILPQGLFAWICVRTRTSKLRES